MQDEYISRDPDQSIRPIHGQYTSPTGPTHIPPTYISPSMHGVGGSGPTAPAVLVGAFYILVISAAIWTAAVIVNYVAAAQVATAVAVYSRITTLRPHLLPPE
jgi:hypothetical protein